MKKKITLKHLAEILGVTPATISKALRDSNDISMETRKKVKALAAEKGYRPNLMARSLVQKKSFLLGVVVPNLQISFFSECVRGIYEEARRRGYEAIIMVNDENAQNERRNIDFLSSFGVDGILINAVPGTANFDLFKYTKSLGIPFVSWDRSLDELNFPAVIVDDESAGYQVVEQLIKDGKKKIVFLGPTHTISVAKGRFAGYKKGLSKHGIDFDPELVVQCDVDIRDAHEKTIELLKKRPDVDAIMSVGGLVAFGAGKAILEAGYDIPGDIAISEFGDNDLVARLGVPYLTVYQYPYRIGTTAVDLILDIISNPELGENPIHRIIETKIIYHEIGLKNRYVVHYGSGNEELEERGK